MRLTKIKLAGFKSFVDPTTIQFMGNLSAIVGPNGCGKSNVIDAVRWVMGESSAKQLRGGSITDVIFNGSSARKPVGQATVELLFDNSDGKLGGEYAHYSEIAIKRQVTRDAQSNYFLNGQRCRRKDITDIFLGTGLGPRSYAIIEQGTISRVIEAKPDDLRVFVEEAAGISKYKERRRETENRINHTQENLARLNDLRDEIAKQIRHLERQSQAAEKYKTYMSQAQETGAQLAALAWKRLDDEIQKMERHIREDTTGQEAEQTRLVHAKTQQEKQRILHNEISEALNEVQKRYYGVGGDLSKIEQSIQHHQERDQQYQADKNEAQSILATAQSQWEQDRTVIAQLQATLADLDPQYEIAEALVEEAIQEQQLAETALEQWREKTAQLQQNQLNPTRQAEAEKAKIMHVERQIQQAQERIIRLETAKAQTPITNDQADIELLDEKITQAEIQYEESVQEYNAIVAQKETMQQTLNALRPQIKTKERALTEIQGQQSALQTLQAAALGKNEDAKRAWLLENGIDNKPYFAEKMEVVAGWECALETVLEGYLDAIAVEEGKIPGLIPGLDKLIDSISAIEWPSDANLATVNDPKRLLHYVKNATALPRTVYSMLSQIEVAANATDAQSMLSQLSPSGSIITAQGQWFGSDWMRIKATTGAESAGVLQREEKLKQLGLQIALDQQQLESLQLELDQIEVGLNDIEQQKEAQQQAKNQYYQAKSTAISERTVKANRLEQNLKRQTQFEQELMEAQNIINSAQQEANIARSHLQEALDAMAEFNHEQQTLALSKDALTDKLADARLKAKGSSQKFHELALQRQAAVSKMDSLAANIDRVKQQVENYQKKIIQLSEAIEKNKEPFAPLQLELEILLEKRVTIENELSAMRDTVAQSDNTLRQLEKDAQESEQKINLFRDRLEKIKMQWQALQVHKENAIEKLSKTEFTVEALLAAMPEGANENDWQQQLVDLEQKIQRLGAINLAAIEEFSAANERKEYLDLQYTDLTDALATLDDAIKKIDRETRNKFKETFDTLNERFTQFFPKIFGGGQAQLVMTGEDLLDTGVSVIARPPGKKNSTIQLLSGGEKALTAVALVFAIFSLNPAPFCILDEVDAPLDDNNVGRFCDLVKEMSQSIQFIYISHNKLAIGMAEQLQGVTMREPGVSRMVTVDIEAAQAMV